MTHEELKILLDSMSLAEKAGQLAQIPLSACIGGIADPTGPMMQYNLTPEQVVLCGSLICDRPTDAEVYAKTIREMRDAHPHKIPPILMRDIIHGFRTVFPIPLAMGCSFDEDLAEQMGRISAIEGAASGVHASFAPMVDVVRDPRWGRCMESPGESPLVCGAMGAAMVKGLRGKDLKDKDTLAACVKHYAAYGLCQAGMEYAPADCSRTEMYNVYLPPFKQTLDAGCDMVMPSFITVDRVPCVCNEWLLKDILRQRWGSDAMVISDYADVWQLINHGVAEDLREAAKLCIRAGMDMDMMSFAYLTELEGLVESGEVDMTMVDEAVLRVLQLKNKLGMFEDPVRNEDNAYQQAMLGRPEFMEVALQAAQKSCVLLKNENVLPLKSGMKVALTGDMADSHKILGGWTLDGDWAGTETLLSAFSREDRITLTSAEEADVILYAVGEDEFETGEGGSKTRPWLTQPQMEELCKLHAMGKPVVVILFTGRAMILGNVVANCDALLNAWFPGSMGAEAIRSLVMGDVSPSGRNSVTFARSLGQVPIHHDKLTSCRLEDQSNKYSNRYVDERNDPLYPFGYGLSYTTFAISDAKVSYDTLCADAPVTASITVTNTGDVASDTVVQLYSRLKHGAIIRAVRNLIGWKRIHLAPGESVTVELPVTQDMLTIYDAAGNAILPKGECLLAMGFDSAAEFNLSVNCR